MPPLGYEPSQDPYIKRFMELMVSASLPQPSVAEVFDERGTQNETIDSMNAIIRMRSRLLQVSFSWSVRCLLC